MGARAPAGPGGDREARRRPSPSRAVGRGPGAAADTISIRGDMWCPVNCDPKAERPGYMIEIAREVFEPKGHKIDYQKRGVGNSNG